VPKKKAKTRTRKMLIEVTERECDSCGEWFVVSRSDARYCSAACRMREHRKAKKKAR